MVGEFEIEVQVRKQWKCKVEEAVEVVIGAKHGRRWIQVSFFPLSVFLVYLSS